MNQTSIKLIVADDHPVVLHGLVALVTDEPSFKVVAACKDGLSALEAILQHSPHIALLDLRLPKMTGLDVLRKVSGLQTRVVIITAFAEDSDLLAAISHGVYGIIMKDWTADALLDCLRTVSLGSRCLPPELVANEANRLTLAASIDKMLTSRERAVICLVAKGLSNKDAATQLQISEGTVKLHLHSIYCKVGVNDRAALVAIAHRIGILSKIADG